MASSYFLPQNNFPDTENKPESILTDLFFSAYKENMAKIHPKTSKTEVALSREISIQSYGIADIVAVAWDPVYGRDFEGFYKPYKAGFSPTVRSFEVKISDWKKALRQAFRYKFFSNVSIVLLPKKKLRKPIESVEYFKKLKIGLWGFDMEKGIVEKVYTPRYSRPLSKKQHEKVIKSVLGRLDPVTN